MTRKRVALSALTALAVAASALSWSTPATAADPVVPVAADGAVPVDPAFDGPRVTRIRVLEEAPFLEIHWDRYVDELAAVNAANLVLRNGTRVVPLKAHAASGGTDTIFFDRDNQQIGASPANSMARLPADLHIASIGYVGAIDPGLPLTLEIDGDAIADASGRPAQDAVYTGVPKVSYYTQSVIAAGGIVVKANERVAASSLALAAAQVDVQLSRTGTGIAETMVANGCSLAVYGARENAYLVPEHRGGYNPAMYDVEGYGGSPWNGCVSSISERNVLRTRGASDPFLNTGYRDENILVHEFGHAVLLVGIERQADKTLFNAFLAAYNNARDTGLWPNTYAISNRDEYFATLSTIWFNNMAEAPNWADGVRSPINTRAELRAYDRQAYDFFASIYPSGAAMPAPWDVPSPDLHHGGVTPSVPLAVTATATARCVAGKAYLAVTVNNGSDEAADATVVTPWGSKTFAGLAAGRSQSVALNTRATTLIAGSVPVTAVGADTEADASLSATYPAIACS
ncbi:MAG TPA: hypothetical protein PKE40_05630 [Arachnia sp.]|nr:hypothetical protein [Arachnia sp.]HMT85815.1 hypothetical protein [Arachnia sp.]